MFYAYFVIHECTLQFKRAKQNDIRQIEDIPNDNQQNNNPKT